MYAFTDIQWEKDEAEDVEGVCNDGEDNDSDWDKKATWHARW